VFFYLSGRRRGEGEIPVVIVRRWRDPLVMPPSPLTNDGIDYDDEGGG
jgi:hypothetical protein